MATIQARHEGPRGCGYRKKGGLYLVSGKLAAPCGKLPCNLHVCPTCGQGFKPFRGWGWIDAVAAMGEKECAEHGGDTGRRCRQGHGFCPLSDRELRERGTWPAGLIWVGEKYYPTVESFTAEAAKQGISRRIKAVPKDFVLGETWVFFAHRKAGRDAEGNECPALFQFFKPTAIEYVVKGDETEEELDRMEQRGIVLVDVKEMPEPQQELSLQPVYKLRAGETVKVYEDPITQQRLEGMATLVELGCKTGNVEDDWHLEEWKVQFLGDSEVVERRIRVEHAGAN